ncbi:MAG: indole-3-glycerol phosphate synthase TrpC [Acidobacteriota bacterium]
MSEPKAASADLLATIVAATARMVDVRSALEPASALAAWAAGREPRPGRFRAALAATEGCPRVIAECKRRSPSRGVLRRDYDPAAIARSYERAGAAAISVLTEPTFFDGALAHLAAVREAVAVPVLRKDFVVSEYQLLEARAAGADAVLLIVAALSPGDLARLHQQATDLGLDVLVEVHDAEELAVAIEAGAGIIGVNNRNLRTLTVDLAVSEALAQRMPRGIVAVSESGLKSAADLARLQDCGYHAFLIGERFMGESDPGAALASVLAGAETTDVRGSRMSVRMPLPTARGPQRWRC